MKKAHLVALLGSLSLLVALTTIVSAQWSGGESLQRLKQQQSDEMLQRMDDKKSPAEITLPSQESKEIEEIAPTGYVYREMAIRELNLGGSWAETLIAPSFGFEAGYRPMEATAYRTALSSKMVDGKLKGTDYWPYYTKLRAQCAEGVQAKKGVHVRALNDPPAWVQHQRKDPPQTLYRVLWFQCLAEGIAQK